MIRYDSYCLSNGLQLYVIPDPTVKTVVMNLAYNVGARDEDPKNTGFAHLFEHLMFGGSKNIPEFDTPLQKVGGENNAFTTSDYTNYYMSLPSNNIETGFWLESDRMLSLSFDPKVLDIQRKVVIEEFKQRYLNKPYGDIWHKLRPVVYQSHPYRWPVIGSTIEHIENAKDEDVKEFFFQHYNPDNAVLVVGGDVETRQVIELAEKWFGPIDRRTQYKRNLPTEPVQNEKRQLFVEAEVPQNALYMVFHIPGRNSEEYQAVDLMSDLLGRGKSSRLYQKLVKEAHIFTSVSASVTGTMDPGLLVISGFLSDNIEFERAEDAIWGVIGEIQQSEISDDEHAKIVNQAISVLSFGRVEILEKCMGLAYAHLLGDPESFNLEPKRIRSVSKEDIHSAASRYLGEKNSTIMYYSKKKPAA